MVEKDEKQLETVAAQHLCSWRTQKEANVCGACQSAATDGAETVLPLAPPCPCVCARLTKFKDKEPFSCKNASILHCCWHIDADDMGGGAVAMGARECIVIVPPLRSWPLAMTSGASESFKLSPAEVSNTNVVRQFSKARNAREVVQANLLLCVLGRGDKRQCPPLRKYLGLCPTSITPRSRWMCRCASSLTPRLSWRR